MGGCGSGRWNLHRKRLAVEDCLPVDVNKLVRDGLIQRGRRVDSTLTWVDRHSGEVVSSAHIVSDTRNRASCFARLAYTVPRISAATETIITLTATTLPWGATRWWFACPRLVDDEPCGRRITKLYLPPSHIHFGCRHCHDLTYTSCQEAHMYEGLCRNVASEFGMSTTAAKRLGTGAI